MRILRSQNPSAQSLQFGLGQNGFHQPFGQPLPAKRFQYKHVCNPRKCGIVGKHASKPNLLAALVNTEGERVLDRSADSFSRCRTQSRRPFRRCKSLDSKIPRLTKNQLARRAARSRPFRLRGLYLQSASPRRHHRARKLDTPETRSCQAAFSRKGQGNNERIR